MSGRVAFIIPGDVVKALGANTVRRLHWAEWGRRVAQWKERSYLYWRQAGGTRFQKPVRITYTIRRARRCDLDNAAAATKAITDGLKGDGLMVFDDDQKHVTEVLTRLETSAEWKGREEVLVVVEEIE